MSTISERIKLIRTTCTGKKMSRDEFAARLGVSNSVVTNWEDAENRLKNGIPDYSIKNICKVFHINYVWLTTGKGNMLVSMSTDDLVEKYMADESELTKSMMKALAKLPDEEWAKLRDLIEQIKKEGD